MNNANRNQNVTARLVSDLIREKENSTSQKSHSINLRNIDDETYQELKIRSEKQNRSISNYVMNLIYKELNG